MLLLCSAFHLVCLCSDQLCQPDQNHNDQNPDNQVKHINIPPFIKAAEFFASCPLPAENPEEFAIVVVVSILAAWAPLDPEGFIGMSFCHAAQNIRCDCWFQFAQAVLQPIDPTRIECSRHRHLLCRVRGCCIDDCSRAFRKRFPSEKICYFC